jgi:hypothetical protein
VRPEVARAERFLEVRRAARAWEKAGVVGAERRDAIVKLHPDDRVRLGPALRTLAFVFALFALIFVTAFLGLVLDLGAKGMGPFLLMMGVGLAAVTEWQTGPARRAQAGAEAVTALAAAGFLVGAGLWFFDEVLGLQGRALETFGWALGLLVFAAAAWRWGASSFMAAIAAVCIFGLLGRGELARPALAMAAALALVLGLLGETSARLAPSHREGAKAVQLVAAVGLYVALHLGSWDEGLLEGLGSRRSSPWRPLFVLTTALVPIVLIGLAIGLRRRFLLLLGAAAAVASLVTLRFYVHVAPLWVVLTGAGLACMALALLLQRWLDSGRDRSRGGFTADPLFDEAHAQRLLEIAVSAGQAGVAPQPARPDGGGFQGGGGDAGGGGSTDRF